MLNGQSFQALVEFFGTLSKEWALECMKDLLLVNLRGNLQIIVQVGNGVPDVVLYIFPIQFSMAFLVISLCYSYNMFKSSSQESCTWKIEIKTFTNHDVWFSSYVVLFTAICRLRKNIVNTWESKLALSSLSSSNHMKDCISS